MHKFTVIPCILQTGVAVGVTHMEVPASKILPDVTRGLMPPPPPRPALTDQEVRALNLVPWKEPLELGVEPRLDLGRFKYLRDQMAVAVTKAPFYARGEEVPWAERRTTQAEVVVVLQREEMPPVHGMLFFFIFSCLQFRSM